MSPIPIKKDPEGKPGLAGTWPILLFLFMTIGMLGLGSALQQQRSQAALAALNWKPTSKSGTSAGFSVKAHEKGLILKAKEWLAAPEVWDLGKNAAGLKLAPLESATMGDAQLVVAFVADVPLDFLMRKRSGAVWEVDIDEGRSFAGEATSIVIAGQPTGVFEKLKVTGIDAQGLPYDPTTKALGEDGMIAFYEFDRLAPGEIQFLRIDALPPAVRQVARPGTERAEAPEEPSAEDAATGWSDGEPETADTESQPDE